MATERVKRLKDLVERLERLPATPERERVLSEVRSRAVDLETGVTPRAMLPLRESTPPPPRTGSPSRQRASGITRTPPPLRAAVELAHTAWTNPAEWISADDRLSLEDAAQLEAREPGRAVRPWTLGLRG
jgi:hypothetical protein